MKTNLFKNAVKVGKRTLGTMKFKFNEYSPAIFLGAGVVCVVAGTVFACKATLSVDEVIDEFKDNMKNINSITKNGEVEITDKETGETKTVKINENAYTKENAKKDKVSATLKLVGGVSKKYALPATLTALGIIFICKSYGIMNSRLTGAVMAYESCKSAFDGYRERVKKEVGEEKEQEIYYGYQKITQDNDGNIKTEYVYDDSHYDTTFIYSKETSFEWQPSASYNQSYLKQVQNSANDRLHTYGYMMLFELLDMLGMERTPQSFMLGWLDDDGQGFISLGVLEGNNPRNQRFLAGLEQNAVLHPNVDGIIRNVNGVKIKGPYDFVD